jgi:hypothetical protein
VEKNELAVDLLPITVLTQYEDLGEQLEEYFAGFLTGENHAMYIERTQSCGVLMIVEVEPTNDPSVYLTISPTLELGQVDDLLKKAETVEAAARKLKNMTAYEFVTKVMSNVKQEVDFENMIVPAPANLESGVV